MAVTQALQTEEETKGTPGDGPALTVVEGPSSSAGASDASASPDAPASPVRAVHGGIVMELRPAGGAPESEDPEAAEAAEKLEGRLAYRALKRGFDVAFSAAVLVGLSPLLLLVALAVKVDDPSGPVLFSQERVGRGGRTFRMYKFRSMCPGAEGMLEGLRELNEKTGPVFKMAEDPRVTRVGRLIRKTSIDELPQFVNVLKGDMSVVGPRPALPSEVAAYTPRQRQRLLVRPGMTCIWQTRRNRDSITFDEWVDLDLLYIKRCGLWADLKLIAKTVGVVLTAQGS